jgi:hypothetical protein
VKGCAILKYIEQKQLREALQNELNKQGLGGNGQSFGTNEAN